MADTSIRRLAAFIFKLSNHAIDISIEHPCDGEVFRLEVIVKAPVFWRRRFCRHTGKHPNGLAVNERGEAWCLLCDQLYNVNTRETVHG